MRTLVLVSTLTIASACGAEPTQVFVHFGVSEALAARARQLSVVVYDHEGDRVLARVDPIPPIGVLPVVPLDGDASRRFRVEATLLDDAGTVIARASGEEGFDAGIVRDVTLVFTESPPHVARGGVVCAVPDYSTGATGGNEVPGSQCAFTPTRADEVWIVVATATLFVTGADEPGGDLILRVDGVEQAYGEGAGQPGQSWQGVGWVTGDVNEHVASLELAGTVSQSGRIEETRIVAFPLSAAADFQVASLSDVIVRGEPTPVLELALAPRAPGRYVVLVNVATSESPGGSGIQFHLETPGGPWPTESVSFGRAPFIPYLLVRVIDVPIEGGAYTIVAHTDSAGSLGGTLRDSKILAFRVDDFASVAQVEELDEVQVTSTTPVEVHSLTAPAVSGATWVTLDQLLLSVDGADDGQATLGFRRDGAIVRTTTQHSVHTGSEYAAAFADLVETSAELTISAEAALGSYGTAVHVQHSNALLLQL